MTLLPKKSLLSLAAAAVASAALAGNAAAAPTVKVHSIFGGKGIHVGQILDVRAAGAGTGKAKSICWDPAPIGRPACSASENGAPSATGTTKLTVKLADGTTLHKSITAAPAFKHRGGDGGSDAAPGHVCSKGITLWGNVPQKGSTVRKPADKVTTLDAGAQVAQYNRIGDYVLYWEYATNKAGFGKLGCVTDGLGS
ncbi:hypothetical protein [Conexibacter woesei]|uniref:hypothetical protein n=1 Tax=Conexibacter woesei TaxID=191495 RepID=UPI0003FE8705|nr:hypothetical protein [Conexibacter woesei]